MRRRLLAGIVITVGAVALACGGGSTSDEDPANDTVVTYYDSSLPPGPGAPAAVQNVLNPFGLVAETISGPDGAAIIVSDTPSEAAVPVPPFYWVVAVGLAYEGSDITAAELIDALRGGRTVYAPVTPSQPPLAEWFPGLGVGALTLVHIAEMPRLLAEDTSALALMHLGSVDPRVRTLAIDGASVVFGTGDLDAYPLASRSYVSLGDIDGTPLEDLSPNERERIPAGIAAQSSIPPLDPIVLRATGDILPVRCTYARMLALGDMSAPFRALGPWLAEADITVGSLDAAVSDAGTPIGCVETFSLMGPAAAADGFALAGYDVITVATNHVKDCGQNPCGDDAFFDTLDNLRSRGIEPVGGGAGLDEARAPAVLTVKGVRFAFLGYDEIAAYYHAAPGVPGTAPLNEAYLREDVAAAAVRADVVVVLPQWGIEYQADPTPGQRLLATAAVESGAGLVIGNHPHWVQAAEVIDGAFVAYALGNFVFDQDWSLETQQGVVLDVAFHGDQLKGIEYHPIHIYDEHQPRFAPPGEARQILDRIWNASAGLQ